MEKYGGRNIGKNQLCLFVTAQQHCINHMTPKQGK
jgi:hypothetical protein